MEKPQAPLDMILDAIRNERLRQDQLWGTEFDDKNTCNDWATYAAHYATSAAMPTVAGDPIDVDRFKVKMLKAAAICVAAIEACDRNDAPAKRHYDA